MSEKNSRSRRVVFWAVAVFLAFGAASGLVSATVLGWRHEFDEASYRLLVAYGFVWMLREHWQDSPDGTKARKERR